MSWSKKGLCASALVLAAVCNLGVAGAGPLLCPDGGVHQKHADKSKMPWCPSAGTINGKARTDDFRRGGREATWQLVDRGHSLSHIQLQGRAPAANVPEPGTLALLGVGLLGAGIARRRKRS